MSNTKFSKPETAMISAAISGMSLSSLNIDGRQYDAFRDALTACLECGPYNLGRGGESEVLRRWLAGWDGRGATDESLGSLERWCAYVAEEHREFAYDY